MIRPCEAFAILDVGHYTPPAISGTVRDFRATPRRFLCGQAGIVVIDESGRPIARECDLGFLYHGSFLRISAFDARVAVCTEQVGIIIVDIAGDDPPAIVWQILVNFSLSVRAVSANRITIIRDIIDRIAA